MGFEVEGRITDEAAIWISMSVCALCHADGSLGEFEGIIEDITERKRAEEHLRFLAEASAILGSSLDYEVTLQSITRLAVPRLADTCDIFTLGADGTIQHVVAA